MVFQFHAESVGESIHKRKVGCYGTDVVDRPIAESRFSKEVDILFSDPPRFAGQAGRVHEHRPVGIADRGSAVVVRQFADELPRVGVPLIFERCTKSRSVMGQSVAAFVYG